MGKGIVYCRVCGNRIPSSDFDSGRAETVTEGHACRKCATGVNASVPKSVQGPAQAPSRKNRTGKIPVIDPRPAASASKMPMIIAGVIGVIALLLLIYVAMSKSGRPN